MRIAINEAKDDGRIQSGRVRLELSGAEKAICFDNSNFDRTRAKVRRREGADVAAGFRQMRGMKPRRLRRHLPKRTLTERKLMGAIKKGQALEQRQFPN